MAGKAWQPGWYSYPVSPDFRPGLFVVGDDDECRGVRTGVMPPPKVPPYSPTFFQASLTAFLVSLPKRLVSPAICSVIDAMSLN